MTDPYPTSSIHRCCSGHHTDTGVPTCRTCTKNMGDNHKYTVENKHYSGHCSTAIGTYSSRNYSGSTRKVAYETLATGFPETVQSPTSFPITKDKTEILCEKIITLVDGPRESVQRSAVSAIPSIPSNHNRCVPDGLGSLHGGPVYSRSMVRGRANIPYQFARVENYPFGDPFFPPKSNREHSCYSLRQHDCCQLCEQTEGQCQDPSVRWR